MFAAGVYSAITGALIATDFANNGIFDFWVDFVSDVVNSASSLQLLYPSSVVGVISQCYCGVAVGLLHHVVLVAAVRLLTVK